MPSIKPRTQIVCLAQIQESIGAMANRINTSDLIGRAYCYTECELCSIIALNWKINIMKIGVKFNQLTYAEYLQIIEYHQKYTDFNTLGL